MHTLPSLLISILWLSNFLIQFLSPLFWRNFTFLNSFVISISFFMNPLFSFSMQAIPTFSLILVAPSTIFLTLLFYYICIWTNILLLLFMLKFPTRILIYQKMLNFAVLPHFSIWNKIVFSLNTLLNISISSSNHFSSFIFLISWCNSKCLRF